MPDIISGKEIRSYHFKYKYVKFTLDLRIGNPRGFSRKKRGTVVVNTQDKLHLRSRSSVFETSC